MITIFRNGSELRHKIIFGMGSGTTERFCGFLRVSARRTRRKIRNIGTRRVPEQGSKRAPGIFHAMVSRLPALPGSALFSSDVRQRPEAHGFSVV